MRMKRYWWLIFGGVALTLLALSFWLFSGPSTCEPRQDDPEGYLFKICLYIQEKQIDVSPADPTGYHIKRIEEREENGLLVLLFFLNFCYLGDIAVIDKATGEVISFEVGAQ